VRRPAEVSPCHPCNVNGVLSSLPLFVCIYNDPGTVTLDYPMFTVLYATEELKEDNVFTSSSIFRVTVEAVQL
jgi:hypothetical protein